jgi:hypothetical protein
MIFRMLTVLSIRSDGDRLTIEGVNEKIHVARVSNAP